MMSARRIARELAVILLPQLPRDRDKLERLEFEHLVASAVQMLVDYAKQNLADADALLARGRDFLTEIELEHPDNAYNVETLEPVPLTTGQLRQQLEKIDRALHFVSEALDIPEIAIQGMYARTRPGRRAEEPAPKTDVVQFLYDLVTTYLENRQAVDAFIRRAKAKWKVERMVSIDRDILRLAATEAFFMPEVPVRVAVSEAVELTHRFADEKAARFINGVLADMSRDAEKFRRTGDFPAEVEGEAGDAAAGSGYSASKH